MSVTKVARIDDAESKSETIELDLLVAEEGIYFQQADDGDHYFKVTKEALLEALGYLGVVE